MRNQSSLYLCCWLQELAAVQIPHHARCVFLDIRSRDGRGYGTQCSQRDLVAASSLFVGQFLDWRVWHINRGADCPAERCAWKARCESVHCRWQHSISCEGTCACVPWPANESPWRLEGQPVVACSILLFPLPKSAIIWSRIRQIAPIQRTHSTVNIIPSTVDGG